MHIRQPYLCDNLTYTHVSFFLFSSPKLILMDRQMPVMDGCSATESIRDINLRVPIVGLTANSLDEQRVDFLSRGLDDVLIKPLDQSKFRALCIKYSLGSAADEGSRAATPIEGGGAGGAQATGAALLEALQRGAVKLARD